MSEQTVMQLLKELGGAASSSEISRFTRLWKLKKLGLVDYDANKNKQFIIVVGLGE